MGITETLFALPSEKSAETVPQNSLSADALKALAEARFRKRRRANDDDDSASGYSSSSEGEGKKEVVIKEKSKEEKIEEAKRTILVKCLPVGVTKGQLLRWLELERSKIDSLRFRSIAVDPKFKGPQYAAIKKRKLIGNSKMCYIVLKEKDVIPSLLEKTGNQWDANSVIFICRTEQEDRYSLYKKGHTLFIGRLPRSWNEIELFRLFSKFGSIQNIRIIRDQETWESKSYGFVFFKERSAAKAALSEMQNVIVNGHPLRVTAAADEKVSAPSPQKQQKTTKTFKGGEVSKEKFRKKSFKEIDNTKKRKGFKK